MYYTIETLQFKTLMIWIEEKSRICRNFNENMKSEMFF